MNAEGLDRIGGWHRKGLGETRLGVPSDQHGSLASAVGMLQRFVGYRAVARSDDGAICGWKMDGGTELHKLGSVDGHKGGVSALALLGGKPSCIKQSV